jgi:hypothetical protein
LRATQLARLNFSTGSSGFAGLASKTFGLQALVIRAEGFISLLPLLKSLLCIPALLLHPFGALFAGIWWLRSTFDNPLLNDSLRAETFHSSLAYVRNARCDAFLRAMPGKPIQLPLTQCRALDSLAAG